MKTFLSDERRDKLSKLLDALSSPERITEVLVNMPDDLEILDKLMAQHADYAHRCKLKREAGDHSNDASMMGAVMCLLIYKEEAEERGLGENDFPQMLAVMKKHLGLDGGVQ